MLIDVKDDREFQAYLDRIEQQLHVRLAAIIAAAIRLLVTRSFNQAQEYIRQRGRPLLALFYRRIYRDQYAAVTKLEEKAGVPMTITRFMEEQLFWLDAHAADQINGIAQSVQDQIATIVSDKMRQGKGPDAIAREIRKQAPALARGRAAAIARTETHNAAMAAIEASMKSKNITIASKTWLAVGDRKTRPTHRAANGQSVPFNEPFSVGGAQLMRPGDSSLGAGPEEIVNCRCSVLYETKPKSAVPPPVAAAGGERNVDEAVRLLRSQEEVGVDGEPKKGGGGVRVPFAQASADEIAKATAAIPSRRANLPEEDIELAELTAIQPSVGMRKVEAVIRDYAAGEGDDKPLAFLYRGKTYLWDGTHRATAAYFLGKGRIRMRILTLPRL
jgi:SPP1 gp7 family putative phage head morphogenesis protein